MIVEAALAFEFVIVLSRAFFCQIINTACEIQHPTALNKHLIFAKMIFMALLELDCGFRTSLEFSICDFILEFPYGYQRLLC